ncbi:TetR family transcriptional regulator [Nakamurella sp. GG22]
MPPDSTDTKRRLLAAALDEFAEHGLAGARVDRIAERAKANKRLIYAYFGNKEQLFDTVMAHSLGVLADAVPFTADDLPGYAAGLFDHMILHPDLVRLTLWKSLERPAVSVLEMDVYRPKVTDVAAGQRAGTIAEGIAPIDVLILVIGLVASWFTASPSLQALGDGAPQERLLEHREALMLAVHRITGPSGQIDR